MTHTRSWRSLRHREVICSEQYLEFMGGFIDEKSADDGRMRGSAASILNKSVAPITSAAVGPFDWTKYFQVVRVTAMTTIRVRIFLFRSVEGKQSLLNDSCFVGLR